MSPKYFLNFFSNLYISQWFRKRLKFMMLGLLANTLVSQKIDSVHFHLAPKQKLSLSLPADRMKLSISPKQWFMKIYFFTSRKGKDYGAEKTTKLKTVMVLVTCFDKFNHLFKLSLFGFCFVEP